MHDKFPLPRGEGTLGIDRAIKTHNSMLVLRGPSRLVVRDPRGETSASRENAQHNKYRKTNRNQAKSTLRRKKGKIWLLTLDGILTCLTFDILLLE